MPPEAELLVAAKRLHQAGKLAEAEALYQQMVEQQPGHAEAWQLLGIVALSQGRNGVAETRLRQAIALDSSQVSSHYHLGQALRMQQKHDEAISALERSVELDANYLLGHLALAGSYLATGQHELAAAAAQSAEQCGPSSAGVHNNLGSIYQRLGRAEQARRSFATALRLQPDLVEARINLGMLDRAEGRLNEAVAGFRQLLDTSPRNSQAWFHLGATLQQLGESDEALVAYTRCLEIDPRDAQALANLGMVHFERHRLDAAIDALQRAIAIQPGLAAAYDNLGVALQAQGRLKDAIACYRQGVAACPEASGLHTSLAYLMNFDPRYRAQEIFAEHCRWGERHADPLTVQAAPHTNDQDPERRLRIGYLSAQFRTHSVNRFTEPILAEHDHSAFEIYCYNNSPLRQADDVTRTLQGYADQWREIATLSDEAAADLIRADEIDILVDLAGYLSGGRMLLVARKPAPVQVSYIGYQATTGMTAMDYRLTDAWADPPGATDAFYTEKLVRMPNAFFCFQPASEGPAVTPLPADTNGHITFGSFNNVLKITPDVLAAWARVLHSMPDSRLLILTSREPRIATDLDRQLGGLGIEPDRWELAPTQPLHGFLESIGRVDIGLDTFPFTGHTTTCDQLWMGVPVVTLAGDSYVQRFGSSAHINLGLESLVATTPDEYVAIACALANALPQLRQWRAELRDALQLSTLCDARQFTHDLEAEYRQMWRTWCDSR